MAAKQATDCSTREPFFGTNSGSGALTKVQNQSGTGSASKSKITDYLAPISNVTAQRAINQDAQTTQFDNQKISSVAQNEKVSHTFSVLIPPFSRTRRPEIGLLPWQQSVVRRAAVLLSYRKLLLKFSSAKLVWTMRMNAKNSLTK